MPQLNLLQLIFISPRQRRYWMMIYNQAWFEKLWDNRHDTIFTEIWRREFRVSPTTFEFIVDLVRGQLEKHHTNFRQSICYYDYCKVQNYPKKHHFPFQAVVAVNAMILNAREQ